MTMIWGIDLGGTKIEGVVLESIENPKEISRIRIKTEAEKGYNHVLNKIKDLVFQLKKDSNDNPNSVCPGLPGYLGPKSHCSKT